MGYGGPNAFPVFLRAQTDGSVVAEVQRFEEFVTSGMQRTAQRATQAIEGIDRAFNFSNARRQISDLEKQAAALGKVNAQRSGDPFGIAGSIASLKNSPIQRYINDISAAEGQLDTQRRRAHTERMSQIQSEFDAAMRAIQERRQAQQRLIDDMIAGENSLVSLQQQKADSQRRMVGGREYIQAPSFDPASAQQSASAARAHAQALNELAAAAEMVAAKEGVATATDRAYATTMRESAVAADAEAARLEELAATQGRVAASAKGLNTANLDLQSSVRGSRFATLQASQQFQDFFIQVGSGQNALVAFSQQASQLAFVMAATGGETGKFARIMAGGTGTVAFALLAIIPLGLQWLGILGDTKHKTDDANLSLADRVKKLDENAAKTRASAEADDAWARSAEGAAAALKKITDEIDRQNESLDERIARQKQAIQLDLLTVRNAIDSGQANLTKLREQKADAEKALANLNTGAAGSAAGAGAASKERQAIEANIAAITKQIDDAIDQVNRFQKAVKSGEHTLRVIDFPLLEREARNAVDPIGAINTEFDRMRDAAENAATGNAKLREGLQAQLTQIEKNRKAALDAEQERQRAAQAQERDAKKAATYASFQMPVNGRITSGFGAREAPKAGASTNHRGLDLAVPTGTPVHAPQVGTVESVGFDPKLGKFVIINHGAGTTSRFGHLSTVSVRPGDQVNQGDVFAQSGATGNVTGPHLHYEVRQGGKFVDPRKGSFPVDEFKVAAAAQKAQEQAAAAAERAARSAQAQQDALANGAERAAERVATISAEFDKQPRLIDRAAKAQRQLLDTINDATKAGTDYDNLIAKLKDTQPPGWEAQVQQLEAAKGALGVIIANAQQAQGVVQEGLLRPFQDILKTAGEQRQIDELILQGREDQADALRTIFDLERDMGPLTQAQKQNVEDIARAERARGRALQENEKHIARAVRSAENLQDALTGIIQKPFDLSSWKNGIQSVFRDFKQNFWENISEKMFGNMGADMEDALRMKKDPLGSAGTKLTTSATNLTNAASALSGAAQSLSTSGGPSAGQVAATPTAFAGSGASSFFGLLGKTGLQTSTNTGDIADLTQRQNQMLKNSSLVSDPTQYYNMLGASVGKKLDGILGTNGFFGKIGGKMGTALEGASIGESAAGLLQVFGMKPNKGTQLGSQLGGAIGSLIAGPVGAIVGGLLGGIVGGIFGKPKKKKGSATIGGDEYGNLDVGSSSGQKSREQESKKAANDVIDTIERLAEQLNLVVDATKGKVSVGIYGDDYRVDPTGGGRVKGSGVINFGGDAQGAMEAAVIDLIEDGVLSGLREGTKKLLTQSRDLQKGLEKALKFENVFKELKERTDPLGAAMDDLNTELTNLRKIFMEAGATAAEYAQLEQLYALKRQDAIKEAQEKLNGVLQDLLKDLTYRGDTGLSLRTRESRALADFAPYQQAIQMGQGIDQDKFADVVRTLLDIEREMYGSGKKYFDMLNLLTSLTQRAISNTGGAVSIPGVTTGTGTTTTPTAGGTPTTPLPTGQVVNAPALDAAANDNFQAAGSIVFAINEQTKMLEPFFLTPDELVKAIRDAFSTISMRSAPTGDAAGFSGPSSMGFVGNRFPGQFGNQGVDSRISTQLDQLITLQGLNNEIASGAFGGGGRINLTGQNDPQAWWNRTTVYNGQFGMSLSGSRF